nr:unnamed protein product [Callosobruchus analis]
MVAYAKKCTSEVKPRKIWFDTDCEKALEERHTARLQLFSKDNEETRRKYNDARRKCKNLLRYKKKKAKKQSLKEIEDFYKSKEIRNLYQGIKMKRGSPQINKLGGNSSQDVSSKNGNEADENDGDSQKWQFPRRISRRRDIIYGKADDKISFRGVVKLVDFHVFRCSLDVTPENLKRHLNSCGIVNVRCEEMKSKYPDLYESFRVSVLADMVENFMDPEIWLKPIAINSFLANYDTISVLIATLKPLVVCLSETHLTQLICESEIAVTGYQVVRRDSVGRHTGGVTICVRNDCKYRVQQNVSYEMNYWFLLLKIIMLNSAVNLGCIYHSPNASHSVFLEFYV